MSSTQVQNAQSAMDHFGARITARLSESADDLPHDVSERLRAARVQAVDKRKSVLLQTASALFAHGQSGTLSASRSGEHASWWQRLGAVGLLFTLVVSLFAIGVIQDELKTRELADIDTSLLTDDLPPAAYVDVGFAQYLKAGNRQER